MNAQDRDMLQRAGAECERHLNEMLGLFKPGVKLSLIMRMPGNPDCEFVMTTDDMDALIETIQRRKR